MKDEARALRLFTNSLRHALGLRWLYYREEEDALSEAAYKQTEELPTVRRWGRQDLFTSDNART